MSIEQDLEKIAMQERELVFDRFDLSDAWGLGARLVLTAQERNLPVVVAIRLHSMPAFYVALPGAVPDNEGWVRRKGNVCLRFFQSSYAVGLKLKQQQASLSDKFALADADYAAHGGSFPILVSGSGCIGAVTVSGLPQRDDHELVVEVLAKLLGKDPEAFRLGPED